MQAVLTGRETQIRRRPSADGRQPPGQDYSNNAEMRLCNKQPLFEHEKRLTPSWARNRVSRIFEYNSTAFVFAKVLHSGG